MRVLVTRPEPDAARTAVRLAAAGHVAVVAPLQSIQARAARLPEGAIDAVAVTSANAIRHAGADLLAALRALPCFAVGAATGAEARGVFADVRVGPGDARALAALIAGALSKGARLAFLCGAVRKADLEQTLATAGLRVEAVETYEALEVAPPHGALAEPVEAALVYSAGAARRLGVAFAGRLDGARLVCISAEAAAALPPAWRARTVVAERPDESAMIAALDAL